jgi:hypothetical protein
MNTNYYQEWMTDEEIVRLYEGHGDPAIRRLVRIILVNGFFEVPSDSSAMNVAEYVDDLKGRIQALEGDLESVQQDADEATAKADKLSVRTVPQLLADLANLLKEEQDKVNRLNREVTEAKRREEEALHKMNMWAILNK